MAAASPAVEGEADHVWVHFVTVSDLITFSGDKRVGMGRKPPRAPNSIRQRPLKLLAWAALVSLLFGLVGAGEGPEDALRTVRNGFHTNSASGQIVLVGVDAQSLRKEGEWPWSRSVQAALVRNAQENGARRMFLDLTYEGRTTVSDDEALASAIRDTRAKGMPVTLAIRDRSGIETGERVSGLPLPTIARHADVASISVWYNYQNAAWLVPYMGTSNGGAVPTFASALAGLSPRPGHFRVDYSIDVGTVPYISAGDLADGSVAREEIAGKTLVLALNSEELGDRYWIPGRGKMAGALIQIIGAETLLAGPQGDLGWIPAWILALVAVSAGMAVSRPRRIVLLALAAPAVLGLSLVLEAHRIFVDIVPGLLLIAIVAGRLLYASLRKGSFVNNATGLANLAALKAEKSASSKALVAVRVRNFAHIASTLSSESERQFVRQIASRMSAGQKVEIFQGDEGIFAWLADPESPIGDHLEALHTLFRSPVMVDKRGIDVALTFGVELGTDRQIANRLGSALVAADEAWTEGLKWKYHDPARQEDVSWRLSLLGELDAAIDNGEVWVAFQPQMDLRTGRITGAEALARWTHPVKGPIGPTEFIAAAEQNGRIEKLSDFVLDQAIATAAAINARGTEFTVAVNISARLLAREELVGRVLAMLKAHGLAPERLTLELTETEALHDENGARVLDTLRRQGVRIAIDDYGTGLSTLDYLKKIPASEIKIDQSFVRAMRTNRSDLIMVQSTIALAHSLGRTVVAEGVEDVQCLDELGAMGCDIAQGYVVDRPMAGDELIGKLAVTPSRKVA